MTNSVAQSQSMFFKKIWYSMRNKIVKIMRIFVKLKCLKNWRVIFWSEKNKSFIIASTGCKHICSQSHNFTIKPSGKPTVWLFMRNSTKFTTVHNPIGLWDTGENIKKHHHDIYHNDLWSGCVYKCQLWLQPLKMIMFSLWPTIASLKINAFNFHSFNLLLVSYIQSSICNSVGWGNIDAKANKYNKHLYIT